MSSFDDLLRRLDAAEPTDWEEEYARSRVEVTQDQAIELVRSERGYAKWFAFRFDAGPPGEPLPTTEAALEAVLLGDEGTPRDAYRVVFGSSPIPDDAPADLRLALLCNTAACALKGGASWFATWLAARAGVAAIALGAPERAWYFLDGLTIEGRRHPHLDKLATFEPLRRSEAAQRSLWVRATICRLWPWLGVPVVPTLPFPDVGADEGSLQDTLDELSRIDAIKVRELVESFVTALDLAGLERHTDDPLVRELRTRALEGSFVPPIVERVPSWFPDWARSVARVGGAELARLAGLVLAGAHSSERQLAAMLVLPAARAVDLEVLAAGVDEPELRSLVDELTVARAALPTEVADALIAAVLPRHVRQIEALGVLAEHVDLLGGGGIPTEGVVEQVATMVRTLVAEQQLDHEAVRPLLERMIAESGSEAGRLNTARRRLNVADVERAAAAIGVPELTTGLLELCVEAAARLPPLDRLLLVLALRRVVGETHHKVHWDAPLAKLASDSIYDLRELGLFDLRLRLRLLGEAIEASAAPMPRANLYFQRANTRGAMRGGDEESVGLALTDLNTAIRLARAEGDPGLCAAATAARAKTLAWSAARDGGRSERLGAAESAIADALNLTLAPIDRATLHQARAHLLRLRSPAESVGDFEAALALLVPEEPFWSELAAEIVVTLLRAEKLEEAVQRGTEFLDQVGDDDGPGTELGMLHLALGEALLANGRTSEARRRLESGLQLVRGRDPLNEALARLHLARLGLATGDRALSEEHLRFLRDHREDFDSLTRRDLDLLEAAAAAARGNAAQQRAVLIQTLSTVRDESVRVGLRLEVARLDLVAGRPVHDLDALVLLSLEMEFSGHHDAVLTDLLCNHEGPLAPSTREEAIRWARQRRRPSIVARLQHNLGRTQEAQRTLRDALAGDLDSHERLGCTHQLMTLLDNEREGERRALCAELERLLDSSEDVPHVRLDLAAGMCAAAGGDLGIVLRARAHACRALEATLSPREQTYGHRTMGQITVELLRLSAPLSSPSIAQDASWLLDDLALDESEASKVRVSAAYLLLLPGPLAHSDSVSIAGRLLDLVMLPPDAGAFEMLAMRLRWVRGLVLGSAPIDFPTAELRGPFDGFPNWIIAHVHGRGGTVAPQEFAQAASVLPAAVRVRPDVADALLAKAISVQHKLSRKLRNELLDAVYSAVQSVCEVGHEDWPRLSRALDGVRKKHRCEMLQNIKSAMGRSGASEPKRSKATAGGRKRITRARGRLGAMGCFERGVSLMEAIRLDPYANDAGLRISESRALLKEAVEIARKKRLPGLFDFLVSYGNAWRLRPDEDVAKALRIYESAAKIDARPEQKAKLWKVQADALRLSGKADELRQADRLLERASRLRGGRWLAETLMSRAQVCLVHPDLDGVARERAAASFTMDAVMAHRGFGDQDGVIDFLLHRLAAWERKKPGDPTPARVRAELRTIYPARATQIDEPRSVLTEMEIESIAGMMVHPAGRAYLGVRTQLVPASERGLDLYGLQGHFGPSAKEAVHAHAEENSLVGRPERMEEALASLVASDDDAARPGILAARVILMAHLARFGRRSVEKVQAATTEAIDEIGGIENALVRAGLLREVAVVWAPDDHLEDPVRDFALSVELLRRCVELEGGENTAVGDTLAYLARSLRYSPAGDLESNLREARRLYKLRLSRGSDGSEVIANLMHNLADVESQMGTGNRLERMRVAEQQLVQAVSAARSPHREAQYRASLAWERTQIGSQIGGEEGRRFLEKALATFDEIELALLDRHGRRDVEGNRRVCEATLARFVGGRTAEIVSWREYLSRVDERANVYSTATAKHNLANALLFGDDVTREELDEGLRLSREAAEVRTLEANPRHHWETAINVGRALCDVLVAGRLDILPLSPGQAETEAGTWLRRATAAARVLGPGQELLDAAFALGGLAAGARTTEGFVERTEEAWMFVREASAYLLLDPQSRGREAWWATSIAVQLAYRLAERSISVRARGLAFVLQGEDARLVEQWIVRAQQPARRPLQARLSRPNAVSVFAWDAWQAAVDSHDQRRMADALDRIRESAPSFLAEEHANEVTWRWIEARPGSIAVSVILAEPVSLALLMLANGSGERKTWVLGLELPSPPLSPDALTDLMGGSAQGASAHAAVETLAQWARNGIVEPIERFLGESPSAVLWSSGPDLRLVAPSAIWRTVPVAATTSLVLPSLASSPSRRRSSLVVLADPGPQAPAPRLDLRGQGMLTLEVLERAAARRGPVRLLGSVGAHYGRGLLGVRSEVRDTPASVRDVLLEAAEHEIIVLVAHGQVETLDDAAVLCLDASGNIELLDVAQLGQSPNAFAGATVLLLSCEGGRMSDSPIDPGGLAGTLLSAGAASVVAPLWPVRLDVAEEVGRAVLEGMTLGDEPWAVLARLHLHAHGDSPTLGRPAPSPADRQAELNFQRLAFVAWVG